MIPGGFTRWATTQSDRCPHGYAANQHPTLCPCEGLKAKSRGQAIAAAAHPDELAKVEAAIRRAAASGRPFSANEIRPMHGQRGGVVGKAFTNMKNAGVIKPCGDETSTAKSTNGHRIFRWQGVAA